MEPVRRSTLVVNNTTIINQTVINQAPSAALIEKTSGRKVQVVAVQELRHTAEAAARAKQRTSAPIVERKVGTQLGNEVQPPEKKTAIAHAPTQAEKPSATALRPVAPDPKHFAAPPQRPEPVLATAKVHPAVNAQPRTDSNHPAVMRDPAKQTSNQHPEAPAKFDKPSGQKMQLPGKEQPAASARNEPKAAENNHENKAKE
jgi:hypothetical protein